MDLPLHQYSPIPLAEAQRTHFVTLTPNHLHQLTNPANLKTQACGPVPGQKLDAWRCELAEIVEREQSEQIGMRLGSDEDVASTSAVNAAVSVVKNPAPAHTLEDPEARLRSMLDSVSDNVAVLDTHGNIVMTNVAWQQFALAYSPQPGRATPHSEVGSNYLDVSSRRINPQDMSGEAVQGIRDVLSGNIDCFSLRYTCHTPDEQHWFTMIVTPLEWNGQRGAQVRHTDTTPRHRLHTRNSQGLNDALQERSTVIG